MRGQYLLTGMRKSEVGSRHCTIHLSSHSLLHHTPLWSSSMTFQRCKFLSMEYSQGSFPNQSVYPLRFPNHLKARHCPKNGFFSRSVTFCGEESLDEWPIYREINSRGDSVSLSSMGTSRSCDTCEGENGPCE